MERIYQIGEFEIFNCLPHSVWVFDISRQKMFWANRHALELWNSESLDALQARDFRDTSAATIERLRKYLHKFERGENVTEQWTFYPRGEPRVVFCVCSGVRIEGNRLAMLVEGRPLSKTEIDPNVLRCVEALHHTSLMVAIFSLNGDLIFQNPISSRIFIDNTAHRFVNRFKDCVKGKAIWNEVLSGKFVSQELEFVTKVGVRWHGADFKLTEDPVEGGKVILANHRDLHELKKTELQLEKAIIKARESVDIKSRFLANMSHEIRTPLNGILGMAQLLARSGLDPSQQEHVNHMKDAAKILHNLIDDILDYSKLDAGRLSLNPSSFSPKDCFQTCVALIEPEALAKGLRFLAKCDVEPALLVKGDELRLSQILINLLNNAIKFTGKGEIGFEIGAEFRDRGFCHLRFRIWDTGIGISPENQQKLFQRFSQIDDGPRRSRSGTGLGLAICLELINLMAGEIKLSSELAGGTSFLVTLKFPVVSETKCIREESENFEKIDGCLHVLLVEDNPINSLVAQRMLAKLGHRCTIARHGENALVLLAEQRPDLILMDVEMPVMDGLTATRIIREREGDQTHIPIVALTANVMPEDRERCFNSQMDDFLAKPIDYQTLARVLRKWQHHIAGLPVKESETKPEC